MSGAGAAVVHPSIPRTCGFCGGRLGSKRTIVPNRRRRVIGFIAAFVGTIGFWVFAWNFFIADVKAGSGVADLLTFLNVMRVAGLMTGVGAIVVYLLVRKLPDTVLVACSACRKENVLLVRFAGPLA